MENRNGIKRQIYREKKALKTPLKRFMSFSILIKAEQSKRTHKRRTQHEKFIGNVFVSCLSFGFLSLHQYKIKRFEKIIAMHNVSMWFVIELVWRLCGILAISLTHSNVFDFRNTSQSHAHLQIFVYNSIENFRCSMFRIHWCILCLCLLNRSALSWSSES